MPIAAEPSMWKPSSSGPRWRISSSIAWMSGRSAGRLSCTNPAIPHIEARTISRVALLSGFSDDGRMAREAARFQHQGELQFVDMLRRRVGVARGAGVVLGIGDDCAIVRPKGSAEDLLYTTDMLIEGVHFLRETHRAEDVGWKALARGLSDIAAMGGEPRFCLLSLAVAEWCDQRWIDGFYRGLLALAQREGAPLIGGDLAKTDRVMCDIVVGGAVP